MKDNRMKHALESIARRDVPENINLWPHIATRLERKTFMTTVRTRPLVTVLIALLVLLTLTGVAYAIGSALGYIPGVGFIEQSPSLRVLEKPFTIDRENISLTIEQVVASPDKTIIVYHYFVPVMDPSAYQVPMDPNSDNPALVLPDGNKVEVRFGRRIGGDGLPTDKGAPIRYSLEFPPLPTDVMEVTLELPYLPAIPAGAGPTDWKIPLKLISAPEGTVLPAFKVVENGAGSEPAPETAPSSEIPDGNAAASHGITASVDLYVPLEDGALLVGSMQWLGNDYPANAVKPNEYMKVTDATGREISFEPVLGPVPEKPGDEDYRSYWAIKVLEKSFAAPLRIRIDSATVNAYIHPFVFQFDPGPNPVPGQSWDINKDFQIGDIQARVLKATLTTVVSPELVFQFDIQVLPNELADVYISMKINQCMGGGGSYPIEPSEVIQASAYTCRTDLPPGPLEAEVSGALVWGPWQVEWTPPETSSVVPPTPTTTPLSHPETCLSMDKFEQARSEKPALPEGFGGKVILYGSYQGNNSVWKTVIVNLDGSEPQTLGDGDGNFSPDGTTVAFSRNTGEKDKQGIYITDLITGETVRLLATGQGDFNPIWSPDGSQIAFNRGMGLFDLFAINADGTNLRRLTFDKGQEFAIGWMPDGQHLLYTLPGKAYEYTDHVVDVQTGAIEYFSNDEFLGMSPDIKYKITAERDPANMDAMVSYFSSLDGSNRWPLTENDVVIQTPIWSANGEWLLASMSELYGDKYYPVFIHLSDCQIVPLPKLDGVVLDWLP